MLIRDAMTRDVRTVTPSVSLREAARAMADMDVGALPVQEGDRLVGMVTDRDIAVRGVAIGKGPDTTVGEVMTHEVLYCYDDEDVEDVCENLADMQVRRLPVVSRDKRLVGIVSLADIAAAESSENAGQALEGISRPGGLHSQSEDARA
ncbi:CBS domain-containing protein [Terricaulis sp.]|uniref:CBS domain-containing protein n=1 Tax=Terricaulis sp. TaxID=2768686 RepID=UPI003784FE57